MRSAAAPAVYVVLPTPMYLPEGFDKKWGCVNHDLQKFLRYFAATRKLPTIDAYSAMSKLCPLKDPPVLNKTSDMVNNCEYMEGDGIHPSEKGAEKIADWVNTQLVKGLKPKLALFAAPPPPAPPSPPTPS